jgi:hypothetical protein
MMSSGGGHQMTRWQNAGSRFRKLALAGLVFQLACGGLGGLPLAPSELTTGVVLYEHIDYAGLSAHVAESVRHLDDFAGPCEKEVDSGTTTYTYDVWDDCISSIRVAPGWQAALYRDDNFDGDSLLVTEDIPDLRRTRGDCRNGGFNDCTTSICLTRLPSAQPSHLEGRPPCKVTVGQFVRLGLGAVGNPKPGRMATTPAHVSEAWRAAIYLSPAARFRSAAGKRQAIVLLLAFVR